MVAGWGDDIVQRADVAEFHLDFTADLGSTVIDIEDLGDGTERVTVRSNASFASQARQFFRLEVNKSPM